MVCRNFDEKITVMQDFLHSSYTFSTFLKLQQIGTFVGKKIPSFTTTSQFIAKRCRSQRPEQSQISGEWSILHISIVILTTFLHSCTCRFLVCYLVCQLDYDGITFIFIFFSSRSYVIFPGLLAKQSRGHDDMKQFKNILFTLVLCFVIINQ